MGKVLKLRCCVTTLFINCFSKFEQNKSESSFTFASANLYKLRVVKEYGGTLNTINISDGTCIQVFRRNPGCLKEKGFAFKNYCKYLLQNI